MLTSLRLDSFKNYQSASFEWGERNVLAGPNGSGKTNILESIYLLYNALPVSWRTLLQSAASFSDMIAFGGIVRKGEFDYGCRIGYDLEAKTARFLFQDDIVSKAKYLEAMPGRAVFFSPMEMNILYLGPSLRRDFLDEILLLSYPEFSKVRRDYSLTLRSRNALLKNIYEGTAKRSDLDAWDQLFAESAERYYRYRLYILSFIRENISTLESLLEGKYRLEFEYTSKTDLDTIRPSIMAYLSEKRERDIITGHTYIGPHLDDFVFHVHLGEHLVRSEEYLSRWENKTLLIGLKFLSILFLEARLGKKTVLLLDDLFSELDTQHINLILSQAGDRQLFITTQNIPVFLNDSNKFTVTNI